MARSRKRTPIFGMTTHERGRNEIDSYKRLRVRQERARLRLALRDPEDSPTHELSPWNEWASERDGQRYLADAPAKMLRK